VLHAGFYYSPDSFKARFCREGNFELKALIKRHQIEMLEVGKVVVAKDEEESQRLQNLFDRGKTNGVDIELLPEGDLQKYEPLAKTTNQFLWSPSTAVSDPIAVIEALKSDFMNLGGKIIYNNYIRLDVNANEVRDKSGGVDAKIYINASGAQSDRIARNIGVGTEFAMLPFMGLYRATERKNFPLRRLIYPVPHHVNPFLGVHFTLTLDGKVKIGPTAIPVLGREQYNLISGWSISDSIQALRGAYALVKGDAHDFGAIIKSEWRNLISSKMIASAKSLVGEVPARDKWSSRPPGIRAQLVQLSDGKLEQDFVIRKLHNSLHILNAVSPGWTSAIPFGRYISDLLRRDGL
jgi:L-2-hydroxyglutarate oxidase LhgO